MLELEGRPTAELVDRLAWVIRNSPADETEIVWIESIRGWAGSGKKGADRPRIPTAEATIRVRERGGTGLHRLGATSVAGLTDGVRQALALARVDPLRPWLRSLASKAERTAHGGEIFDPKLSALEPAQARERLRSLVESGESAELRWVVGRVVAINNRDLRQSAGATRCTLQMVSRPQDPPGGGSHEGRLRGRAEASARSIADLGADELVRRARTRRDGYAGSAPAALPKGPVPVVLAPKAAAALFELLSANALAADSFHQHRTFLAGRLGETVFSPLLTLRDDATADTGFLPFPFDLLGYRRRPITLIREGIFETPATDDRLAKELAIDATPLAVSGDEIRASHLDVATGESGDEELFARAEGGVWIESLEDLSYLGPPEGGFRTKIPCAHMIQDGRPAGALPRLGWEDSLTRVFSDLQAVGRDARIFAYRRCFLGGTRTPALMVGGATLTPRS